MNVRRISLVVPVYNASAYLHYCLDSVVAQHYQDFELILVDDGSTDDSGLLCDQFADEEHSFSTRVIHKPNGGVSSARNTGITVACGEYIVFADCDDYLEPDYLSSLITQRDAYPDVGHIWCGFQLVNGYNKENAKSYFLKGDTEITMYDRSDYMTLYANWMTQGPYCKLFDASVLKTMRFNEKLSLGEDILFNLEYMDKIKNTQIVFINQVQYNYIQVSDHSLYSKYRSDLYEINCVIDRAVKQRIIQWQLPQKAWKDFYSQVYFHNINAMENTFRPENKQSFLKKIWRNNQILNNDDFQEALNNIDFYINPLFRRLLRTRVYILIYLFNCLSKIKEKMKRIKKQKA